MNFDLQPILRYFERLAPRERALLLGASVFAVGLLGYLVVWEPLVVGADNTSRRIVQRERDLREIVNRRDEYLNLLHQIEAFGDMGEPDPGFNMLGHLQGVVSQAIPREKIQSLNPSSRPKPEAPEFMEETVDIKLTEIALNQIVDLMYRVEKGERPLRFSRIVIKKRLNDPYAFDVQASVSVLRKVEKPADGAAAKAGDKGGGGA